MEIAFIGIGIIVGGIIAWLIAKQKYSSGTVLKTEFERLQTKFNDTSSKLLAESDKNNRLDGELTKEKENVQLKENDLRSFTGQIATLKTKLQTAIDSEDQAKKHAKQLSDDLETAKQKKADADKKASQLEVEKEGISKEVERLNKNLSNTEKQLDNKNNEFNEANKNVATLSADNKALEEKLTNQKKEIETIGKKFNSDFELIANRILEEKTDNFTKTNKTNIESLLKPLGDNLESFKKKVDDVYGNESKERFSLAKEVKRLADLNQELSNEAKNLTTALKADPKAQGDWGEMILESILEQSGLTKGREYFLENYLKDDNGNYLTSEDGKKMRPDAIIQYPDQRKVIIDSKVSLVAYTNFLAAEDSDTQAGYLKQHVQDIKNHIVGLSKRGYENFDKSLDFVMMFIPNEPAYMLAVKEEPNLWSFAYEKRIILNSPTNLIAALKLISNLWDRDHQSKNAQLIVDRGEKLYSKFVGFTENFTKVGKGITTAQEAYDHARKQLVTGNDNLIRQAEKLKALKVSSKKKFPAELLEGNQVEIEPENN